jgi:hypothetical protein
MNFCPLSQCLAGLSVLSMAAMKYQQLTNTIKANETKKIYEEKYVYTNAFVRVLAKQI